MRCCFTTLLAAMLASAQAHAEPLKAVVFDLEMIDTSLDGGNAEQARRLALASNELRRLIGESGRVSIVDPSPQAGVIAQSWPLSKCNGCDEDIAKALGADTEVTSAVQKVSNLILSFSATIKDPKDGKVLRVGVVEIRGNSDEMWLRGIRSLVKNRLLETPLPER